MKSPQQWSEEILRALRSGSLVGLNSDDQKKWIENLVSRIQGDAKLPE